MNHLSGARTLHSTTFYNRRSLKSFLRGKTFVLISNPSIFILLDQVTARRAPKSSRANNVLLLKVPEQELHMDYFWVV